MAGNRSIIDQSASSTLSTIVTIQEAEGKQLQNMRDFANNLCHEVRNPLNGITMSLSEMFSLLEASQKSLDPDLYSKLSEYIEDSTFCAGQIEAVVNDQLDLAKIESGMTSISKRIINLSDLIKKASKVIRATTKKKSVEVEIYNATPKLYIISDQAQLNKVIINLLTNAAKFTDQGKIQIKTEILEENDHHKKLVITVSDTGIGMTEDAVKTLFQKFKQKHKNYSGTGLGLCLVKSIIELMQGHIEVKSCLDKGTEFKVFLSFENPTEEQISEFEAYHTPRPNIRHLSKTKTISRIMVVEDNAINLKLVTGLLEKNGYEVMAAKDGESAIKIYQNNGDSIGLILMDIELPDIDGLQATALIRGYEKNSHKNRCPIIGLSGNVSQDDANKALVAGMDAYLTKPIDIKKLLKAISQLAHSQFGPANQIYVLPEGSSSSLPSFSKEITNLSTEVREENFAQAKSASKPRSTTFSLFSSESKIAPMPSGQEGHKSTGCCIIL